MNINKITSFLIILITYWDLSTCLTSLSIQLTNDKNNDYYAVIGFGTPPQKFPVLMDSGSADLWIVSTKCTSAKNGCSAYPTKYDNSKSSTYVKNGTNFAVTYGDDAVTVKCFSSKDTITLYGASGASLTVKNQMFGEATSVPVNGYYGILGLAWNSDATGGGAYVPTVLQNLFAQNQISTNIFSFYLNRNPTSAFGGELYLGGSNSSLYVGNFVYTPVIEKDVWMIHMDGVTVGNVKLCTSNPYDSYKGCYSFADSGHTLLSGPKNDINLINKQLSKFISSSGLIDCTKISQMPNVNFSIGGKNLSLSPYDYVYQDVATKKCSSGFKSENDEPIWILGDIFMGAFYTQYDGSYPASGKNPGGRVGFARAIGSRSIII